MKERVKEYFCVIQRQWKYLPRTLSQLRWFWLQLHVLPSCCHGLLGLPSGRELVKNWQFNYLPFRSLNTLKTETTSYSSSQRTQHRAWSTAGHVRKVWGMNWLHWVTSLPTRHNCVDRTMFGVDSRGIGQRNGKGLMLKNRVPQTGALTANRVTSSFSFLVSDLKLHSLKTRHRYFLVPLASFLFDFIPKDTPEFMSSQFFSSLPISKCSFLSQQF